MYLPMPAYVEPKTARTIEPRDVAVPGPVCFLGLGGGARAALFILHKAPMAAAAAVVQDAPFVVGACADKNRRGYRRDLMDDAPHQSSY